MKKEREESGKPLDHPAGDKAQGAAGKGRQGAKAADRRPFDGLRENLEAMIVAVVLALIIRHFSVEAFEIPTGSMAPTLYGIHAWVRCPNCDSEFNLGLQTDASSGDFNFIRERRQVYWGACPKCKLPHHRAFHDRDEPKANSEVAPGDTFVCPNDGVKWNGEPSDFSTQTVIDKSLGRLTCPLCWYQFKEVLPHGWWYRTGGHKILVDKFLYKIARPERWDVIVFQYDRETNYIKRLIGKPGERIELKGGDLHINGKIERKSTRPEIQEVLWTKIGDLDIPERGYQKIPAWKEVFPKTTGVPAGSWRWDGIARRWSVNAAEGGAQKISALRYQRPIVNFYNYNLLYFVRGRMDPEVVATDSADPQVGDKKVAFKARVARGAKGWIGAEIQDGSHAFQARIPLGRPNPAVPAAIWKMPPLKDMDSFQPDRPPLAAEAGKPWPTAAVAISPDSVVLVEFENADDRVALRLDGVEVLSLEYDSGSEMPKGPEDNGLFILAGEGAACDMESVRVFRDISYTEGDARMVFGTNGRPLVLGAADQGGEDQYFACGDNSPASSDGRFWGPIPARNLMGRALLVFWPLWPTNWQFKFIR